uniref:Uncharacterized protein n=1 Tax=Sphaerodactylus townsendi TaxID=933632 RepID=A0ACB8GGF0_9SAUR
MRGVILTIVYESTQSQGQIEKHLNCIKERLVKHFETLKVPVKKRGVLKSVQKLQSEEEEKIAAIEAGLVELQDAIGTSGGRSKGLR